MPVDRLEANLRQQLDALSDRGSRKGEETVFLEVIPADEGRGPRYRIAGHGDQLFLKMNSNNYLGMSLREELVEAEEEAARRFGTGPGAVRFISGTYRSHVELEQQLAAFHGRESGMIFSSAYATVLGVLVPLLSGDTAVISDELNHNCIINALRLARPREKRVYPHNDLGALERELTAAAEAGCQRAVVVTDGVFSMRGDTAPLPEILDIVHRHDPSFAENAILVVDDSHGVGALGRSGRGTEEESDCGPVDVLVATLGKALGVNGGYVVGSRLLTDYLRETAPTYIYSNPITAAEAAAASAALRVLDGPRGHQLLEHLREMTRRFENGLVELGYETLPGPHPVVPLMVRETARTTALVSHLRSHGILATGLNFPVVPKGDECIRFQISADHSRADIDSVLEVLADFPDRQPRT